MTYELIAPMNPKYTTIEQVLTNRGIKLEDVHHYLHTTESDNLSWSLLKNTQSAAKLLLAELSLEDARIHVQIDSDCDGMTSAALLLNYIHAILPSTIGKFTYSQHEGKQHGIDLASIPADTTMVIAPDSSSSEYEIHKTLTERGIKVLVLDHHEAPFYSGYACVVNNQLCDYPTKSLSGVGVVYKLCQCIDSFLPEDQRHADDFLDLVAVGLDQTGLIYLFRFVIGVS